MKSNISNKDNNYSLHVSENYKKVLNCDINEAITKYSELIVEYFKFITENLKITKLSFLNYIIIRGLDTITHVFLYILYFTKNINLTYFHCQKSFYFYVEFVGQISDDEKTFLQLTSRDATTYVYKKTIFDINPNFKKENLEDESNYREKSEIIKSYINIYEMYLLKIIKTTKIEALNIDHITKLSDKLNNMHNKLYINIIEKIVEKLYYKIEDLNKFFEINHLLVKKICKNPELIKCAEKNINLDDFDNKLEEIPDKFISWFITLHGL